MEDLFRPIFMFTMEITLLVHEISRDALLKSEHFRFNQTLVFLLDITQIEYH